MGFNSAFKGLMYIYYAIVMTLAVILCWCKC